MECRVREEDDLRAFLYIRETFISCLPNLGKRHTSKAMPQGDPLSHIRNVKGIAEEPPLIRLKHLPTQNDSPRRAAAGNPSVVLSLEENDAGQRPGPIRINYTSSAGKASFGADQMVSYASVIHELAYGRIPADVRKSLSGEIGYPAPKEYVRHSLDMFV